MRIWLRTLALAACVAPIPAMAQVAVGIFPPTGNFDESVFANGLSLSLRDAGATPTTLAFRQKQTADLRRDILDRINANGGVISDEDRQIITRQIRRYNSKYGPFPL
jgi:hypothetical protein